MGIDNSSQLCPVSTRISRGVKDINFPCLIDSFVKRGKRLI